MSALITIGIYGTVKAYKWWTDTKDVTVKENQIENKATEQEYTSVPINNLEADHDDYYQPVVTMNINQTQNKCYSLKLMSS